MISPTMILAADVGTLVSVIFVVIAFIGWIMNLASGNQAKQQPPVRRGPPPPRPQGGANEIDLFLQEVRGQRGPQQQQQQRPQAPPRDELEDVDGPLPRREAQREKLRMEQRRRAEQQRAEEMRDRRERAQAEARLREEEQRREEDKRRRQREKEERERRRTSNRIESSVSEHLSHSGAVAEHAEELGHGVAESVQQHLGSTAVPGGVPHSGSVLANITAMFRDPQSVQQAVLLNEILSKPKSQRPG